MKKSIDTTNAANMANTSKVAKITKAMKAADNRARRVELSLEIAGHLRDVDSFDIVYSNNGANSSIVKGYILRGREERMISYRNDNGRLCRVSLSNFFLRDIFAEEISQVQIRFRKCDLESRGDCVASAVSAVSMDCDDSWVDSVVLVVRINGELHTTSSFWDVINQLAPFAAFMSHWEKDNTLAVKCKNCKHYICRDCGHKATYRENCDSFECEKCNKWLEPICGMVNCQNCYDRVNTQINKQASK